MGSVEPVSAPAGDRSGHEIGAVGLLALGLMLLGLLVLAVEMTSAIWQLHPGPGRVRTFGWPAAAGGLLYLSAYLLLLKQVQHLAIGFPPAVLARVRNPTLLFRRMKKLTYWASYAVLGLMIAAAFLLVYTYGPGRIFPDTFDYIEAGEGRSLSRELMGGPRPAVVPLFLNALNVTLENMWDREVLNRVAAYQTGIALVSWLSFAAVVSATLSAKWLKPLGFAAVGLMGTTIHISLWNRLMLSESLTTSFLVLMLGQWIVWLSMRSKLETWSAPARLGFVSLMLLTMSLYSFTRDANAYFVLLAGALALVTSFGPGDRIGEVRGDLRIFSLVVLLVFLLQYWSAESGSRWKTPFHNVLRERILANDESLRYFLAAGMPVGRWSSNPARTLTYDEFQSVIHGQDLPARGFVEWIEQHGRGVYIRYLMAHPDRLFLEPASNVHQFVSPVSTEYRHDEAVTPRWVEIISAALYPINRFVVLAGLALGFALTARRVLSGDIQIWWIVPMFLLISAVPLMLLIWHADAIEMERHAYQVATQIRIAMWLLLIIGADPLVARVLVEPGVAPGIQRSSRAGV